MNQRAAFEETLALAIREGMPEMSAVHDSLGLAHMRGMQKRIAEDSFSESKLGRWLGWAQAALVASGVGITLEDVKQINMRHAVEETKDDHT